eukprot:11192742-Lingulodinium_polyedra.AAC.1
MHRFGAAGRSSGKLPRQQPSALQWQHFIEGPRARWRTAVLRSLGARASPPPSVARSAVGAAGPER